MTNLAPPRRPGKTGRILVGALALAVLVAWVYAPALRGTWVWDDALEVPQNPELRGALSAIWSAPAMSDYFPVKTSLQWLEWHAWGDAPLPYHLATLLLHLGCAYVLWSILRKLELRWSWLGALLFAIHPVAVESVAWIAEQKNTLSLLFALGAFRLFLVFDDGGSNWGYRASLALFLAAMLSKASVVMLPAVLLLHAWWRRRRVTRRDLARVAPFAMIAVAFALVTIWFQSHRAIQPTDTQIDWHVRIEHTVTAVGFYATKALFPLGLSPVYGFSGTTWATAIVGSAAVLGIWIWGFRTSQPYGRTAGLAAGVFVLNLLPVSGVLPMAFQRIAWVADHFAYISLIAVAASVAAVLELWSRRTPAAIVVAAVIAMSWAGVARAHAHWFASEQTLWLRTRAANPMAWIAHGNLGRIAANAGRLDEAEGSLHTAVVLNPASVDAWFNLGNVAMQRGRVQDAIAAYERATRLDARRADIANNLGNARLQTGDLLGALAAFRAAIEAAPSYAPAHANYGRALRQAGRISAARTELETAARLNAVDAGTVRELANLLADAGQPTAAIENYRRALALEPNNAEAHNNLGSVLAEQGQLRDAIREFETAVRLKPDYLAARENLSAARHQAKEIEPVP